MSHPLQPQPVNAINMDGDLKISSATAVMRALPKRDREIVAALSFASPLLRYALGTNSALWEEEQKVVEKEYADAKNTGTVVDLPWSSSTTTMHVNAKDHSSVTFLPALRTRLVAADGGKDDGQFAAGVPEYDINIRLAPFKRDSEWLKTFLKNTEGISPCVRSFNAEFNRHANNDMLEKLVAQNQLEKLSVRSCPITVSKITKLADANNNSFAKLTTLQLGAVDCTELEDLSTEKFDKIFPNLKNLRLYDLRRTMSLVSSVPENTLTSLGLVGTDVEPDQLQKFVENQNKLQTVEFAGQAASTLSEEHLAAIFKLPELTTLAVNAESIPNILKLQGVSAGKLRELVIYRSPSSVDMLELCKNFATRLAKITIVEPLAADGAKCAAILKEEIEKVRGGVAITAILKAEYVQLR